MDKQETWFEMTLFDTPSSGTFEITKQYLIWFIKILKTKNLPNVKLSCYAVFVNSVIMKYVLI